MIRRILLLLALFCAHGAARAEWKKATSDNFIVYSEGSEAALRNFTSKVEAFDSLLRIVSGVKAPPVPKRLEIYLVRSADSVSRLLGKNGRNVAGFYSPRLSGAIAVVPRAGTSNKFDLDGETVLFHEYAHHFMMQYFPAAYAPWYVEGFAEFYSTAEVTDKGTATIGKPAYHRAYGLLESTPFPLARLLAEKPDARSAAEVDAYYGRAWLLTHMLSFSETRRGQLNRYLKAFAEGAGAEKAAADAFGPYDALEKELKAYAAGRLKYRQLAGLDTKAATITVTAMTPAQDTLLIERLNWLLGIDDKEKPGFLARVRKEAAKFPDDVYAIDLLAEAERAGGDEAASAAATDKLLALRSDYGPALLRKAEMLAETANQADDPEAAWKGVRALIVKANRANNDDTLALYQYYGSFARQGVEPPTVAVDGLIRAYELAPQSDEVRLTLASQLIGEKRYREARNVLGPIANAPHEGGSGAEARAMLATIDGEKPAAPPQQEKPGDTAAALEKP